MTNWEFFQANHAREGAIFTKVFKAVIPAGLEYRPDPRSRTARELMGHLIGHDQDLVELITDGVIHHRNQVAFTDCADAVAMLEKGHADLQAKLAGMTEAKWHSKANMMMGDMVIWAGTVQELTWGMFFDSIHHRGQLSTYLRPMGSKVPSMYGPSADDNPMAH